MFTFPLEKVREIIARGISDAATNDGFRTLHPGRHEEPGVFLVGDEGVYLMSDGKLAEGQRPFVVHAEECDPKTKPDYWHYKRQYFGGDDGVEFIDAVELEQLIAAQPDATHLQITMDDTSISLSLIRR